MLSRKIPGAEPLTAVAGIDRGRIGERLQAALAGLEEMRFLREKQSDMVFWALRMNEDDPLSTPNLKSDVDATSEDQRLEATLSALKQKLTHLRRQDVGLKTHLQLLDEQLGELQLSMCKVSAEQLDSDSRPSSGFYELSDGGLGSLSNSCTSVYSECLSSPSQASPLPPPSGSGVPIRAESCRRRSADDSAGRPDATRGTGVRLGSRGIRTSSVRSERARPRPVSTGDLDREIPPGLGCYKPTEVKTVALGSILCNPTMDPKYQSSLVSRSGTEVYRYPSPLHAVALQSPIFTLSGDQVAPVASKAQERHTRMGLARDASPKEECPGPRPAGYVVKLLQRGSSKTDLQGGVSVERGKVLWTEHQYSTITGAKAPDISCGLLGTAEMQRVPQQSTLPTDSPEGKFQARHCSQEQVSPTNIHSEESSQPGHVHRPAGAGDHKQPSVPPGRGQEKTEGEDRGVHFDLENKVAFKGVSVAPKSLERRRSFTCGPQEAGAGARTGTRAGSHAATPQPEFVLAQFVPAGTQMVKVRQADKKTKAVKLKKRSNEKPLVRKHVQKLSSREHDPDRGCGAKTRGDQAGCAEREREERRQGEAPPCSFLETRLSEPGNPCSPQRHPQTTQFHKPSKSCKVPLPVTEVQPLYQAKKKQNSRKWPSASEIQLHPAVPTFYRKSREVPAHRVMSKPGTVQGVSGRSHSGHWIGVPRPLLPSLSSPFYFSDVPFGYPASADCARCPPRCESEYSAECASLFHSTVAGSSEGELSDYTTNRFGDSESSGDSRTASDSSLSLDEDDPSEEEDDEGDLVWAEATVGPLAAGLRPQLHPYPELRLHPETRPEPPACRIKASRALKKKIRRFQPASLKVMTLV